MSEKSKTFITENGTFLSIGTVVIIVSLTIALVSMSGKTDANASNILRFKDYQVRQNELMIDYLQKLDRRTARMQGKMGIQDDQ